MTTLARWLALLITITTSFAFFIRPALVIVPSLRTDQPGFTMVVFRGLDYEAKILDSPKAYCERVGRSGYFCECTVADQVMAAGFVPLPFSSTLYEMTLPKEAAVEGRDRSAL
ncbi:hypothetical protein [Ensifer sp.]|jgi:hypothetical protein|uniref:hypothetical protein n=1 Tax=Ensifer sp. TaxID=1872086 RepID=UPI002E0E4EAD|nr:hypothetical protein [Ensifer sp.]